MLNRNTSGGAIPKLVVCCHRLMELVVVPQVHRTGDALSISVQRPQGRPYGQHQSVRDPEFATLANKIREALRPGASP